MQRLHMFHYNTGYTENANIITRINLQFRYVKLLKYRPRASVESIEITTTINERYIYAETCRKVSVRRSNGDGINCRVVEHTDNKMMTLKQRRRFANLSPDRNLKPRLHEATCWRQHVASCKRGFNLMHDSEVAHCNGSDSSVCVTLKRGAAAYSPWVSSSHLCTYVTKLDNLVPVLKPERLRQAV